MIDQSCPAPSEKSPIELSEEAIRLRSKEIWEREGCPEGCAQDHWQRAKAELEAEQEHWLRAKAELEAQLEKTSNIRLAPPALSRSDIVRSAVAQAGAIMAKAPPPAARSKSDEPVPAILPPRPLVQVKRVKQTGAAASIICADIVVQGALESRGDIQLEGHVEGDVRCAALVVGIEASVQGEIIADDVTVRGLIRGGIRARKVILCSGARVEGDILYETFVAEAGAKFDGTCRQADDPLSVELVPEETVDAETPVEAPRSQSAA